MCVGRSVVRRVRLFATLWTVTHQAPLSRQEYWRGLPFPSPGDLHDPGMEPGSPALQVDYLSSDPPGKPDLIGLRIKPKFLINVFFLIQ